MTYYTPIPKKVFPERVWKCEECNSAPDCPMLKNKIWDTLTPRADLLCITCAELRLGRRITLDDLLPCVGNSFTFYLADNPLPENS